MALSGLGKASSQSGWQVRQSPLTTLQRLLATFSEPVTTLQRQLALFRVPVERILRRSQSVIGAAPCPLLL